MEQKRIDIAGAHILGQKQQPTDDQKLLAVWEMVSQFKNSVKLALDDVATTLKDVALDPPTADALHTYRKMLEGGYENVKKMHARILMRASKPYLKQLARNFEKVQEVLDNLPQED